MEKKYRALRIISIIYKIIGVIIMVFAVLGAIGVLLTGASGGGSTASFGDADVQLGIVGGVFGAVFFLISGILSGVFIYGFGDLLMLLINTEENTRLTAAAMRRMVQDRGF